MFFPSRPDASAETSMQTAVAQFETLRSLALNVTVLDRDGIIDETNASWRDFNPANGKTFPDGGRGVSYLDLCPPERARRVEQLIDGRCDLLTCIYPCHSPRETRWMLLVGLPLAQAAPRRVMLLHINLSSLLPFDLGRDELRALHSPEAVPLPAALDAIVHTIESTIAKTMATNSMATQAMATHALATQAMATHPRSAAVPVPAKRPERPASETLTAATQLPKRQRQVFALLGDGKSNSEIAEALGISMNTAKLHVAAVLRRLGLENRMQAVALAARLARDPV